MVIERVNNPEDLKGLNYSELKILCDEIREIIIGTTKVCGGHLSSNLGAVELSVALLYVFDLPKDKIVYDVGHQCYTHKILTNRRDVFSTLRQYNGMSGYPKREESVYDSFDTGHASTSISAALGMARARDINKTNENIIAVIGDGALTGGLAFEALNDLGSLKSPLITVVNDNGMSISKSVGGLSKYLSSIRANRTIRAIKNFFNKILKSIPLIGKPFQKWLKRLKKNFFSTFTKGRLFEDFGVNYFGAYDGHDLKQLIEIFKRIKLIDEPTVVHIKTIKGKGFKGAEADATYYHGVSKDFSSSEEDFSSFSGECLSKIAEVDDKVVAITASMKEGTGLKAFANKYKDRFFDVGIAEGHAVTMAAGMATNGLKPYFFVYSTFLQRGFDQVAHDVCLGNIPVRFVIDRAGLVGNDGETHHGILDCGFLCALPNIEVFCPATKGELLRVYQYSLNAKNPIAIRFSKGEIFKASESYQSQSADIYKWKYVRELSNKKVVLTFTASTLRFAESHYKDYSIVNCVSIKPIDIEFLDSIVDYEIVVLEENAENFGLANLVKGYYNKKNIAKIITSYSVSKVVKQGSVNQLQDDLYNVCDVKDKAL